jgi:ribosomal protein L40E
VARAPEPAAAPPRPASNPNVKECPHCTASLPVQAMNCRCGFSFGGVTDLPALSLSSSELASILGALGPSGSR